MAQDADIARVAAALRSPAMRYHNFANEPVRLPVIVPAAAVSRLLNTRIEWPWPTSEAVQETALPVHPEGPFDAAGTSAAHPAWTPPAPPSVQPLAPPWAGLPGWPGPPAPAPAPLASPGPASRPLAPRDAWPLLDALAPPVATSSAVHQPPYEPSVGGTFGQLLAAAARPMAAPAWPFTALSPEPAPASSPVPPAARPLPSSLAVTGQAAAGGLLPAVRVTTPLADVLGALGRGVPTAPSPFAGLRAPGGPNKP